MTPCSAAACGSFSSRESSRSACLRTSSGSSSSASCARRSSISASAGSFSPSSSWIAFSCWRRTYSRCEDSISDMTCDWIFEPMATMSSSRASTSESRRSRLPTSTSSSSACFSSTLIRSAPAIRCASADGSSRLATAICSSSGRYGTSSMMCVNVCWTLRISAVSSGPSSTSSGSSETFATR